MLPNYYKTKQVMIRKFTVNHVWLVLSTLLLIAACGKAGESGVEEQNQTEETSASEPEEPTQIASPRKQAEGQIGNVSVVVDYGSPAVKGREVWGGLEPYGKVWRAGANETTSIEFGGDVMIGDTKVAKGKYGFYLIPNESSDWVAIINTDWNREEHGAWGAYNYTQDHDVVRVEIAPELGEAVQERLECVVESDGFSLSWEKVKIKVPVTEVVE